MREALAGDYTAKDFRTWRANVVAAWCLSYVDPRLVDLFEVGITLERSVIRLLRRA